MKTENFYKVRELPRTGGKKGERILNAPDTATGLWRRDVSKDGMTITYRKVA